MKIAVYSICKDEEHNIDGWAASCYDADYAVVCDTGSTDDTFKKFHNHVDYLWKITVDPWRFDTAHNVALALVPADADICIPLHLDERLTPGWRARIEKAYVPSVGKSGTIYPTSYLYPYEYDPQTRFMQNRIHARKGYVWRYPTHEGIYPYFGTREYQVAVEGQEPLIAQVPPRDGQRDGRGDLRMLQFGLQENPGDPRMTFYLARQLMYEKRWADALEFFRVYLSVPGAGEYKEMRDASRYQAVCYHNLGGDAGDVP